MVSVTNSQLYLHSVEEAAIANSYVPIKFIKDTGIWAPKNFHVI